mmetsp:Transcript_52150/g.127332  ORF Transcript_52150/g.127332 Transcript_52150/m.127332 type:complete len:210 (-) Transcript_52150:69-698(-)
MRHVLCCAEKAKVGAQPHALFARLRGEEVRGWHDVGGLLVWGPFDVVLVLPTHAVRHAPNVRPRHARIVPLLGGHRKEITRRRLPRMPQRILRAATHQEVPPPVRHGHGALVVDRGPAPLALRRLRRPAQPRHPCHPAHSCEPHGGWRGRGAWVAARECVLRCGGARARDGVARPPVARLLSPPRFHEIRAPRHGVDDGVPEVIHDPSR